MSAFFTHVWFVTLLVTAVLAPLVGIAAVYCFSRYLAERSGPFWPHLLSAFSVFVHRRWTGSNIVFRRRALQFLTLFLIFSIPHALAHNLGFFNNLPCPPYYPPWASIFGCQ